jgi:hypothetical protein
MYQQQKHTAFRGVAGQQPDRARNAAVRLSASDRVGQRDQAGVIQPELNAQRHSTIPWRACLFSLESS